jgi:hypothetical protein
MRHPLVLVAVTWGDLCRFDYLFARLGAARPPCFRPGAPCVTLTIVLSGSQSTSWQFPQLMETLSFIVKTKPMWPRRRVCADTCARRFFH